MTTPASPSRAPQQPAINAFANTIKKMQDNPANASIVGYLAQISQLLSQIESQHPGVAEDFMTALLANMNS